MRLDRRCNKQEGLEQELREGEEEDEEEVNEDEKKVCVNFQTIVYERIQLFF